MRPPLCQVGWRGPLGNTAAPDAPRARVVSWGRTTWAPGLVWPWLGLDSLGKCGRPLSGTWHPRGAAGPGSCVWWGLGGHLGGCAWRSAPPACLLHTEAPRVPRGAVVDDSPSRVSLAVPTGEGSSFACYQQVPVGWLHFIPYLALISKKCARSQSMRNPRPSLSLPRPLSLPSPSPLPHPVSLSLLLFIEEMGSKDHFKPFHARDPFHRQRWAETFSFLSGPWARGNGGACQAGEGLAGPHALGWPGSADREGGWSGSVPRPCLSQRHAACWKGVCWERRAPLGRGTDPRCGLPSGASALSQHVLCVWGVRLSPADAGRVSSRSPQP
ncbi:uncharacterized protein LOC116668863 [Camelus ferus]|uniref:Uncharacterized protein LOC116668863 n=1 Tax=Camelus ferus TaxID=419612 RepID=A0A8B8UE26_CAMFR|nr:uncharacterized protein LOC116668863 [Camelus ferus]